MGDFDERQFRQRRERSSPRARAGTQDHRPDGIRWRPAAEYCDVVMAVPLRETPRIQEVHLVTFHAICGALEQRLFGQRLVS